MAMSSLYRGSADQSPGQRRQDCPNVRSAILGHVERLHDDDGARRGRLGGSSAFVGSAKLSGTLYFGLASSLLQFPGAASLDQSAPTPHAIVAEHWAAWRELVLPERRFR